MLGVVPLISYESLLGMTISSIMVSDDLLGTRQLSGLSDLSPVVLCWLYSVAKLAESKIQSSNLKVIGRVSALRQRHDVSILARTYIASRGIIGRSHSARWTALHKSSLLWQLYCSTQSRPLCYCLARRRSEMSLRASYTTKTALDGSYDPVMTVVRPPLALQRATFGYCTRHQASCSVQLLRGRHEMRSDGKAS